MKMKKIWFAVVFSLVITLLSACSVSSSGDRALKSIGAAYTVGDYSMVQASCTGFITTSQTEVCLSIPLSKKLLDSQNITVTEVKNAELRIDGTYVSKLAADLTPYINFAQSRNDGAILYVSLKNPDKWYGENGTLLVNNTPFVGRVDIAFTISE